MDARVSVNAAKIQRSRISRVAPNGEPFVRPEHGAPVARIVSIDSVTEPGREAKQLAHQRMLERLTSQPVIDVGPWTREELYDRT